MRKREENGDTKGKNDVNGIVSEGEVNEKNKIEEEKERNVKG